MFEVEGIEIDKFSMEVARDEGFKVYDKPLEELTLRSNSYDVIIMQQVIEQVIHPKSLLAEIQRVLKPGGVVCIECPNIESLSFSLLGKHHILVLGIEHINMFSQRTIRQCCEDVGLHVLESGTEALDISLEELIYRVVFPSKFFHRYTRFNLLFKRVCRRPTRILTRVFNRLNGSNSCSLGSYLYLIAQKVAM